ncbi:MAG: hypothetical protein FWC27_08665 [Firmicutes bacterium]|nr:hypothetical protein [Bacillota bacterium]
MNDILFDQKIAAAFAALPPADDYLKARLLRLPDEQAKPAPRRFAPWKLLPIAGAVAAVVLIAAVVLNGLPRVNPDLPPLQYEGVFGDAGGLGGMGGVWSKNAAELHRASPAYGREGELGTMPVYRNPDFGTALSLDTAGAMEIAEKFGKAVGKTYTYVPDPSWAEIEARIREEQPQKWQDMQEMLEANRQNEWHFQCGDEKLNITSHYGVRVSINAPLSAEQSRGDGTAAGYEAICHRVFEPYSEAIEAMTGLRFNRASTAMTGYDIYGEKRFETFFYVNNPGDPLEKKAEDYALNRLGVSVLEDKDSVERWENSLGETGEDIIHQDGEFYLSFSMRQLGKDDLLGNYPVLDVKSAKRELLTGNCEGYVSATKEELARATIEDVELVYSSSPWLKTWLPVYRLTVSFPPDMQDWNYIAPELAELGLRNYYDFYVPAVPAAYLVPQETDDNTPRPAGGASGNEGAALGGETRHTPGRTMRADTPTEASVNSQAPAGALGALTRDIFAVYTEGGTYHVKYVEPMAGGGFATTEVYAKDGMLTILCPDDPDIDRIVLKDGYFYQVSDSRKTAIKAPIDEIGGYPIPPNLAELSFVGSGKAVFNGEELDYDEYRHQDGFRALYFVKDGKLKRIRHAGDDFAAFDVEYLVFEAQAPDSVFDIPAAYKISS